MLPTGNAKDIINGIAITCIDNGMPVVLMKATDLNLKGNETKEILEANEPLKKAIEAIRLQAGVMMKLGDVSQQTIPKICLVSLPQHGAVMNTRMFIPHVVHDAIGVLAAVSVATACLISKSVTEGIAHFEKDTHLFSIEHPSGEFTVNLDFDFSDGNLKINRSGVIRTARLLSKGDVFIPS